MSGDERPRGSRQEPEARREASAPAQQPPADQDDEDRFVEGLLVRGEVAPEGTEPLPSGVTHEVVEEKEGVPSKVRRRRFSAQG